MAFSNSTNQFERTEGVETEAAIFAENVGILIGNSFTDGIGITLLLCTISVYKKYILALW